MVWTGFSSLTSSFFILIVDQFGAQQSTQILSPINDMLQLQIQGFGDGIKNTGTIEGTDSVFAVTVRIAFVVLLRTNSVPIIIRIESSPVPLQF